MQGMIGVGIIGAFIGSFLAVCIDRVPKRKSVVLPSSHCNACNHSLSWRELIPVVSYLLQRGRCKACGSKINRTDLGIEIVTGMGMGILYGIYGLSSEMLWQSTFLCIAIILSMIDAKHMLLPTCIIRWGLFIGAVEEVIWCIMDGSWQLVHLSILGAIAGYSLFAIIYYGTRILWRKNGLGDGDVRLMGLCGFYLGINHLVTALMIGVGFAGVFGAVLYIKRQKSEPYPLGPFLCLGTCIVLFLGETL